MKLAMPSQHNDYNDMLRISASKIHRDLKHLAQPLKNLFNIDVVSYANLLSDGKVRIVTNRPKVLENYLYEDHLISVPSIWQFSPPALPVVKIWEAKKEGDTELSKFFHHLNDNKIATALSLSIYKNDRRQFLTFSCLEKPNDPFFWENRIIKLYEYSNFFLNELEPFVQKNEDEGVVDLAKMIGSEYFKAPNKNESNDSSIITHDNFKQELLGHSLKKEKLTSREKTILSECLSGKSSKQIAKTLGISFRTVENYILKIRCKYNFRSIREMQAYFSGFCHSQDCLDS